MSNEIKILDGLSHIRLRPEMYIGSTDTPTHLVQELIVSDIEVLLTLGAGDIDTLVEPIKIKLLSA